MSTTRLNLPDDLKRRIARLAASSGQTPHAFMVDALTRVEVSTRVPRDLERLFELVVSRGQYGYIA